ncbi:hypothetical protein ACFL6C_02125 [Myxococcota bacterium]
MDSSASTGITDQPRCSWVRLRVGRIRPKHSQNTSRYLLPEMAARRSRRAPTFQLQPDLLDAHLQEVLAYAEQLENQLGRDCQLLLDCAKLLLKKDHRQHALPFFRALEKQGSPYALSQVAILLLQLDPQTYRERAFRYGRIAYEALADEQDTGRSYKLTPAIWLLEQYGREAVDIVRDYRCVYFPRQLRFCQAIAPHLEPSDVNILLESLTCIDKRRLDSAPEAHERHYYGTVFSLLERFDYSEQLESIIDAYGDQRQGAIRRIFSVGLARFPEIAPRAADLLQAPEFHLRYLGGDILLQLGTQDARTLLARHLDTETDVRFKSWLSKELRKVSGLK